jgi:hypothetical protein
MAVGVDTLVNLALSWTFYKKSVVAGVYAFGCVALTVSGSLKLSFFTFFFHPLPPIV